ncbi:hypothetical protein SS05631_b55600 (plasmid) [Sinorhizobium sp. CCBAU 05631]|nr:hypothetical protein SS05631_b55600 [Sinorhizobium sp. CCBAU 05631]
MICSGFEPNGSREFATLAGQENFPCPAGGTLATPPLSHR